MFVDEKAEGEPWQPEEYEMSRRALIATYCGFFACGLCLGGTAIFGFRGPVDYAVNCFGGTILSLAFVAAVLAVDVVRWWRQPSPAP